MKKILSTALLGLSLMSYSQVSLRANALIETNSATWKSARTSALNAGKKAVGFNVGLSAKIDLPVLFIQPEVYYTHFSNTYTEPITNTQLKAKNNRIDVPLLVGVDVFTDDIGVFAGPVLSYNLAKQNQWNDFVENAFNKFTVGYQLGGQFSLSNLIFNIRYEGRFSKEQREFFNRNISETIRYDNRPNFIMLGLGYQF